MLSASLPILLLWGKELVLLYNDAFRPILTDRHPRALGDRGREFWTNVWPVVGTTARISFAIWAERIERQRVRAIGACPR
jgi:hypothetical protein